MQVTLCDTGCGNKAVDLRDKFTCRMTIGEVKFRVSIEVTKPKQKFYRRLDLCEKCLMMLELQMEHILSSLLGLEDPTACLLDFSDGWEKSSKTTVLPTADVI
jgi:hypothetical protein